MLFVSNVCLLVACYLVGFGFFVCVCCLFLFVVCYGLLWFVNSVVDYYLYSIWCCDFGFLMIWRIVVCVLIWLVICFILCMFDICW